MSNKGLTKEEFAAKRHAQQIAKGKSPEEVECQCKAARGKALAKKMEATAKHLKKRAGTKKPVQRVDALTKSNTLHTA
jgi:hypothetical protein